MYLLQRDKLDKTKIKKITVEREILEMNLFKRGVKGHVRKQIKKIMVASAKHINMLWSDSESVETFLEICDVWNEWNEMNNDDVPSKMFYIIYGWSDKNPNWIKDMEDSLMNINCLQYKNESETE